MPTPPVRPERGGVAQAAPLGAPNYVSKRWLNNLITPRVPEIKVWLEVSMPATRNGIYGQCGLNVTTRVHVRRRGEWCTEVQTSPQPEQATGFKQLLAKRVRLAFADKHTRSTLLMLINMVMAPIEELGHSLQV